MNAKRILKEARPLFCVSGVTGADLEKRIVRIMTERVANKLSFGRKLLLVVFGLALIAGPVAFGLVIGPQIRGLATQAAGAPRASFEVASIKLNKSRTPLPGAHLFNDRFNATMSARGMIMVGYSPNMRGLSPDQLSGGPDWIKSELYDIDAKVDDSLVEGEWKRLSFDQRWNQVMLMLQTLLADRFKLRVRHETKELPVYALVLAKNGPKFAEDNSHPEIGAISYRGRGKLEAISCDFSLFAGILSFQPELGGRVVLDKTGLHGHYSFTFQWAPENPSTGAQASDSASSPEPSGPSLFTALQEQLGLKLASTKASVDVLVIDYIERPSEN
ncbi:MAG: TIGR03435 family protein [Terriglobia bacterium]